MRRFLLLILALAAMPLLDPARPAQAAHPEFGIAQLAPTVAGSSAPSFQFTCTTADQLIVDASGASYSEIFVWNAACAGGTCTPSATPVFLGGPAMTVDLGVPICSTTGCVSPQADLEVRGAHCRVLAGSVTVTAQVIR